jgi:tRNA dimethylallyltransferase
VDNLVVIVGPTAVGKSRLALSLAQRFQGEIVGADSRQVYRFMDIGTDKPAQEELSLIPHHLIGIIKPDEDFSLAQYQQIAYQTIADIQGRGRLPLLVGGSGLYVWSVVEGWQIPKVSPDIEFRRTLEQKAAEGGQAELFCQLQKQDPAAAQIIDPRNIRRVIRALEVSQKALTQNSMRKKAPPFSTLMLGLTMNRAELYRRIDRRVDEMMDRGLLAEVVKLMAMGYDLTLSAMSGIGYRQIGMYLNGGMSLEEAIQRIKYETHRFVRQQYNWFRLKDDRIKWYDMESEDLTAITDFVAAFISK